MAEKYYSQSTYHFSGNNPIFYVDDNGMFYDGYTIDKDGRIERVDDTGGDNYDVLYKKSEYEDAKKEGKVNKKGNPAPSNKAVIYDTNILPDLEMKSFSIVKGTSNINNIFKVFKFAADNSSVEWGLARYKSNGSNNYAIYTDHELDGITAPQDAGLSNIVAFVHNHVRAKPEEYYEKKSLGELRRPDNGQLQLMKPSDWGDKRDGIRPYYFYAYFKKSGNLYHIAKRGNKLIKNVKKYSGFYFGVLNHK